MDDDGFFIQAALIDDDEMMCLQKQKSNRMEWWTARAKWDGSRGEGDLMKMR